MTCLGAISDTNWSKLPTNIRLFLDYWLQIGYSCCQELHNNQNEFGIQLDRFWICIRLISYMYQSQIRLTLDIYRYDIKCFITRFLVTTMT